MVNSVWYDLAQTPLGARYQLQQPLGKRTGRYTFLAQDLQTQEQVVIKVLSLGQEFEWQDLKLFEREAQTLQQLNHPAIPRYLDFLDIDLPHRQGFALVQSYVPAKSLEAHLKAGRTFDETEVQALARSLLHILIYLHEQTPPVIHRDIKPSNILLNDVSLDPALSDTRSALNIGQVYLIDFGSVQHLAAREGGTITVVGTYGYMPPEQFGGRAAPASDLYSLGATLIYLITGRHPTELLQQDFQIQFRRFANVKPELAEWLEWLTQPSLDRRPSSALESLQSLNHPKPRIRNQFRSRSPNPAPRKPPHSDITLHHTDNLLEVVIPPTGIGWGSMALFSLLAPAWIFWLDTALDWAIGGLAAATMTITVLLTIILGIRLLHTFAKHRLRITQSQILLSLELWRICIWRRSFQRQAIGWIVAQQQPSLLDPKVVLRFTRGESSQYGTLLFYLHIPSKTEAKWLAHELSHWLDVPFELH